jgi:CBS domain-containing protein
MSPRPIFDQISDLLDATQPFDRLPAEERESLKQDLLIEYFKAGETVLEQGKGTPKGLYIVQTGLVRLMDKEKDRLTDMCGEGDTFGAVGLMKGGWANIEARAVEDTVCAVLMGQRFQQLFSRHEAFAAFFQSDLKQHVRRLGVEVDVAGAHQFFSRPIGQFYHRPPVTCLPEAPVMEAARIMRQQNVGSLLVMNEGRLLGLVTDSDISRRVVADGGSLTRPVEKVMSAPVLSVSQDANLFEAMMLMLHHGVHRLAITGTGEREGEPLGILTDRDLAHLRGQDPVGTINRVRKAVSLAELASIRSEYSLQMVRLYRQGVQPEQLNHITALLYDRIVVRVLELVEREMKARYADRRVDLPWLWLRMGSGGRREVALTTEQHNGIIFADPAKGDEERAEWWFQKLADAANDALAACGFVPSSMVARRPEWHRPHREWRTAFRAWIHEADEERLAVVPLFFDLRGIYGDPSLLASLMEDVEDSLNVEAMDAKRNLLALLARRALKNRPPVSFFRRFLVERSGEHRHTFNIRERGIIPVVDAARLLALELRYFESTNTFDRLRHAATAIPEMARAIENALDAYRFLLDFRLERQLRAVEAGDVPDNQIDPLSLSKEQQALLRTVFASVSELQEELARRFHVSRGWRLTDL